MTDNPLMLCAIRTLVHTVFTVFLALASVDNLFKLCDLARALNQIRLFLDHSTGDAVSRVSRRVGLQVIGFGMNDQGGTAVAE